MSLAVLADHMASKGRGPDSVLVHMSPSELHGLQALAMSHGGSLTINPDTGLPEAGFLDKLLPAIIGFAVTAATGLPAWQVGLGVGAVEKARTGDLGKGIQAGLGAYGGAGLGAGMGAAGTEAIGSQAAGQSYLASAPSVLADAGAGLSADMAYNLTNAGVTDTVAANAAQQAAAERVAAATPYDKIAAGFDAAKANPSSLLTKDNFKYLAAAAAPVLADQAVKSNLPVTTTKPGMIRPYSFFNGQYVAGNPYEAQVKSAASGGIMGFDESSNAPITRENLNAMGRADGMFNYAHDGGGVMRMAEGGIAGYAGNDGSLVGGYKPTDADVFGYFSRIDPTALKSGRLDADIARDMQTYGVSAADIARITGTQGQQADYERRFVQGINAPTLTDTTPATASEFLAATQGIGLQGQALNTALQNSGLSTAGQYASTHALNDAAGIAGASDAAQNFYNTIGYTAGALPGDQGGLAGMYANINYSAKGLQDQINAGKLTVEQAKALARGEMNRVGVDDRDIKNATGVDFANLFKPKTTTTTTIGTGTGTGTTTTTPSGFHYENGVLVPNISSTQNTTETVAAPTDLYTAPAAALPVGVSGNTGPSQIGGGATVNPNGTITTSPRIPGIPVGGFTGMQNLRDTYTKGGGSLGYIPPVYKSLKEVEDKYKNTGGSKAAYDYLTGKSPYSATPYVAEGPVAKPYSESVMKMPIASSSKMYIFQNGKFVPNPDYAIPTYDKDGNKTYNVTNADVKTFMDNKPSTDAFYTWATTNNLSPEQIALASGRPISEISKLFTGAKELVGEDNKIDPTKLAEKTAADEKANFDADAYLKMYPDVQAELDKGIANFGTKADPAAAAWNHYLTYGKPAGRTYTKKAAEGGLAALTMARGGATRQPFFSKSTGKFNMASPQVYADGGMADHYNLGGYSDGGRLLRGPGDGVSDSIPATIADKRPARLADGEFVVPARIVSELGNGSTEAGARKLYAMMDRVQAARKGSIGKGNVAKNSRADKYLPV